MTGRAFLWLNLGSPQAFTKVLENYNSLSRGFFRSFFHVSSDISQANRRELNPPPVRPKEHRIWRFPAGDKTCLSSRLSPIGSPIRDMCDKNK